MAYSFPYTYYSCSCVDTSAPLPILTASRNVSREAPPLNEEPDEEPTFDPSSRRANFSLFPLEKLLWCTECHEMRCARCMLEEVVCYYCPMCLFEVGSSAVKSEGNRCTRNCYNCPICTSPLTVNALQAPSSDTQSTDHAGPFILACQWCNWTSLDIGIQLEKHNNITGQLSRIRNGGVSVPSLREREAQLARKSMREEAEAASEPENVDSEPDLDDLHMLLTTFYRNQVADSDSFGPGINMPLSSPGSISRLLNMYAGKSRNGSKTMREATTSEGLCIFDPSHEDADIERKRASGWQGTTSTVQRDFQSSNPPCLVSELRPVAPLLRTKRAKRCKTCRTLLAKPEPRMISSRWRHRVLALNNIPKITLKPLNAPPSLGPHLSAEPYTYEHHMLRTGNTHQFLLTAANPLFESIKITLATPAQTPGRIHSRVTILCPEFSVGANSDVWDEAVTGSASSAVSSAASKRRSTILSGVSEEAASTTEGRRAGVGGIWGKGRHWTTVIVEVVPGSLPSEDDTAEDEDVLEIAVFVRFEYDAENSETKAKEKREEAFWCVLGAGKIVK